MSGKSSRIGYSVRESGWCKRESPGSRDLLSRSVSLRLRWGTGRGIGRQKFRIKLAVKVFLSEKGSGGGT